MVKIATGTAEMSRLFDYNGTRPDNKYQHVLKDEIIEITAVQAKRDSPKGDRIVAIQDDKSKQEIELITKQISWTAHALVIVRFYENSFRI